MKLQQQALTLGQCLRCHTSKHPPTDQAAKLKKKARGWQALFHSTKKSIFVVTQITTVLETILKAKT